jgi:hypothetical protein
MGLRLQVLCCGLLFDVMRCKQQKQQQQRQLHESSASQPENHSVRHPEGAWRMAGVLKSWQQVLIVDSYLVLICASVCV